MLIYPYANIKTTFSTNSPGKRWVGWLVGWFYDMSIFVELFIAGVSVLKAIVWFQVFLSHINSLYNQNTIDRWTKGRIFLFPKKGDLRIAKNYRGITLTSIAAKIYNALLRNRIEPKIEKILRKNQNGFRRNRYHKFMTIRRILEGVRAKKTWRNNIICRVLQGHWRYTQREDGANTTRLRPTQRNRRSHNDAT